MNEAIIAKAIEALVATAPNGTFDPKDLSEILFNAFSEILILKWDVSDIFFLKEGLTHEQAITVLSVAMDEYDPDFGITWNSLRRLAKEVKALDCAHYTITEAQSDLPHFSQTLIAMLGVEHIAKSFIVPNHSDENGFAVFFPAINRGFVAFKEGSEAFTECSGIEDLLDRFLNLDGKQMKDAPITALSSVTITL
jgi:hypothetical protein